MSPDRPDGSAGGTLGGAVEVGHSSPTEPGLRDGGLSRSLGAVGFVVPAKRRSSRPDHLGSVESVTNDFAAVIHHDAQLPFGWPWVSETASDDMHDTPDPVFTALSSARVADLPGYRFTGKETDSETGLQHFGAQDEDAQPGAWLLSDRKMRECLWNWRIQARLGAFTYSGNSQPSVIDPHGREPSGVLDRILSNGFAAAVVPCTSDDVQRARGATHAH